jgi:F0F1-type ATP synthase assembly protein I
MRYSGMGLELAAAIVGLTLAGLWVDYKFGTGRKGLIVGATLGIIGGSYNFIRQALQLIKLDHARRSGTSDARRDTSTGGEDDTDPKC